MVKKKSKSKIEQILEDIKNLSISDFIVFREKLKDVIELKINEQIREALDKM